MMAQQQTYIDSVLSSSEALSEDALSRSDCTRSSTCSYPDLTPYSAVSTLTLSNQHTPDILTPGSTAESSPLPQSHKLVAKCPEPDNSNNQGSTPSGSSRLYSQWSSQLEMNSYHSETSSPMHTPSHISNEYYVTNRRTPIPPEPYLGIYGVSDNPSLPGQTSQVDSPYYLHPMPDQNPLINRAGHPMSVDPHSRDLHGDITMTGPMLHDIPRGTSIYRHSDSRSSHNATIKQESRGLEAPGSPWDSRRKRPEGTGNHRAKKPSNNKKKQKKHCQPQPADDHMNCNGEEVPPLLKDTCPDEERCIFESRWRHRNKRGQDMWDSIQRDFQKQFNRSPGKEMLQMKFKRGRSKYIRWIPKDENILFEAWMRFERNRYKFILRDFIELGGSRNMLLNATDIEIKLVSMKIEEQLYLESFKDMNVRRRRKVSSTKKRANGRGDDVETLMADGLMTMEPRDVCTEDEVITQAHMTRDAGSRWVGPPADQGELIDMAMWNDRAPMKIEPGATSQILGGPY